MIENWGLKKFKFPEYADVILNNASNTNPQAKNAAYECYKAIYKWMGEPLLAQIEDKLKKAQIDDLKKMFKEVTDKIAENGGKKDMLQTRSEKAKAEEDAKNQAIDAAMADEKEEEKKANEPDPLEFAPEAFVGDKFGSAWMTEVDGLPKW